MMLITWHETGSWSSLCMIITSIVTQYINMYCIWVYEMGILGTVRIKLICRTYLLLSSELFRMLVTSTWHHKAHMVKARSFLFMNDRKLLSGVYNADISGFGSTPYYVDTHCRSIEWLDWNLTNMVHLLSWDSDCLPLMLKMSIVTIMKGLYMCILCIDFRNDRTWYSVCGRGEASVP